jgi:hypothetical protein
MPVSSIKNPLVRRTVLIVVFVPVAVLVTAWAIGCAVVGSVIGLAEGAVAGWQGEP